ncbi:ribosome hibernation-promoting factor, HPF/YfiA family [Sphingomonas morindae]|uniref:Ribosome hibernation promoting factor n=1 Tax=Sphingomonas morindae TaxID=1541170 RepID=A0ABY4XBF7_9SPHN|nr:ribosome-associated translation inhibitor RaiA [Sphingomonas morindae]USI74242.1 ribosome-associated translation inhibitor RaiA [Sphingomonas morindae]
MEIRVSGHQVDTGDALREHVIERLNGIADKYFSRAIWAQATFGKGPHDNGFSCDIVAHVTQGLVLKAAGFGMEAHPAFDEAAAKIEKQVRRYSKRLKAHGATTGAVSEAELFDNANAGYTVFRAGAEEEEPVEDNPLIIAETRVDVPDASVSDAVMMLDLRNTSALLFKNSGTGALNMVYRRGDGTIGWVEPNRGG